MSVKNILKNQKQIDKITKVIFDSVDADGSGLIELSEFEIVMQTISRDMGLHKPTQKEIKTIFRMLDGDNSGLVSIKEFKLLILSILEGFA